MLLLKGGSPENLYGGARPAAGADAAGGGAAGCELIAGSGTPQKRISDICAVVRGCRGSLEEARAADAGRRRSAPPRGSRRPACSRWTNRRSRTI